MTTENPSWQRWFFLAATLVMTSLGVALGMWQLDRADQKIALQRDREQQSTKEPLAAQVLLGEQTASEQLDVLIHRRMVLKGEWLADQTVYLDNRQMNAKPGFFVVTPLRIEGSATHVLVQRGWVQRSFTDRAALPRITTPSETVQVAGHLAPWPSRLYDFGGDQTGSIRQNLNYDLYQKEIGVQLLGVTLLQSGPPSDGLLREWPVVVSGVEKHHGYAFQWFGLSGLIALLYVWFQIVQPRRNKRPG